MRRVRVSSHADSLLHSCKTAGLSVVMHGVHDLHDGLRRKDLHFSAMEDGMVQPIAPLTDGNQNHSLSAIGYGKVHDRCEYTSCALLLLLAVGACKHTRYSTRVGQPDSRLSRTGVHDLRGCPRFFA